MSKYEKLWIYLKSSDISPIKLTFEDIEQILGFKIDHSFLNYKKEANQFGYRVDKISLKEKYILFLKTP